MTDERLLTAAKLREQLNGRIDGDPYIYNHAGFVEDSEHRAALSFLESFGDEFLDSDLGRTVHSSLRTEAVTDSIINNNPQLLSHLVGITEQDLDASALTLPARLLDRLENNETLTTILAAGNPNTGKTNTASVLGELFKINWPDGLILSNVRSWELTDIVTTSAHDLTVSLLEHRDRPKFVLVDEGSTHFDARTKSYNVASQWSPLQKRMSKIGTEVVCVIGHTGKDIDPEAKRLTNLAFYKEQPDEVEFFERWPAESDRPADPLFGGSLSNLEATAAEYDPDDAAPWAWNLEADLFENDLSWSELHELLLDRGPT